MFKNLTPAEYEVLLRHDFTTFAGRCFQDLNSQTCLATNWVRVESASMLQEFLGDRVRC